MDTEPLLPVHGGYRKLKSFQTRQIETLAKQFETEGGFTERLYRVRQQRRNSGT